MDQFVNRSHGKIEMVPNKKSGFPLTPYSFQDLKADAKKIELIHSSLQLTGTLYLAGTGSLKPTSSSHGEIKGTIEASR